MRILQKQNSEIKLGASSQGLSFNLDGEYSVDEDENEKDEDISDHDDFLEENSATIKEQNKKKKTLVAPHKKKKIVRSQQQALSLIVTCSQCGSTSQCTIEEAKIISDLKREEMLPKFKKRWRQKNHEHELEMAKIYDNAIVHQVRYLAPSQAIIVISKLAHKLLLHPLSLEILASSASYGCGGETQNVFTNNVAIHYIAQG